jgi:hypothetical protein
MIIPRLVWLRFRRCAAIRCQISQGRNSDVVFLRVLIVGTLFLTLYVLSVFRFHLSSSQRTLVLSERLCTSMGALNDVLRRLHMKKCMWLRCVLAKLLWCVSGALHHCFIHHGSLGLYHLQE